MEVLVASLVDVSIDNEKDDEGDDEEDDKEDDEEEDDAIVIGTAVVEDVIVVVEDVETSFVRRWYILRYPGPPQRVSAAPAQGVKQLLKSTGIEELESVVLQWHPLFVSVRFKRG